MAIDRRSFALGALAVMTGSCARARNRGNRDRPMVKSLWPIFKDRFLNSAGRIVDTGNGNISHSEGQGYGLWLALTADDRSAFDNIHRWTEATLARRDVALYSWRYDPRQDNAVADRNNATDGDIFIAWALARAGEQWQDAALTSRSEEIRAAILANLVVERFGRRLLLPGLEGFAAPDRVTVNPSYFIWPAFDAFQRLDGEVVWGGLIRDSEKLLAAARFGSRNLPTDWVDVTASPTIVPAAAKPPRFGFDAVRLPLYAQAGNRQQLVGPIIDYWRGYVRAGRAIPAWIDVQSGQEAGYSLSPGGMTVADHALGIPASLPLSTDYYSAALQMLSQAL